ncbi:hypothetical protein I7I53_08743 [Histoplasma capsulatum var. duboisii H88]|uniref:Secreted protein n=1 Tax=Ajellomyces capsulatus (strain H88) TaxID=544711 RepID=A0A8A1L426_AJEC8|nr:hypothetical protein I7I53_08743 [Histoplasma capsulatum var. duboisii H88]
MGEICWQRTAFNIMILTVIFTQLNHVRVEPPGRCGGTCCGTWPERLIPCRVAYEFHTVLVEGSGS